MKSSELKPLMRVTDANFNRCKEALRVAEDLSRFILHSQPLTASFKKMRHELSTGLLTFPISYVRLLATRDSVKDVGKKSAIQDKGKQLKWQDLMTANLKRAQESLRVLEECSKLVSEPHSKKFQKLRFECYELERRSILKF